MALDLEKEKENYFPEFSHSQTYTSPHYSFSGLGIG